MHPVWTEKLSEYMASSAYQKTLGLVKEDEKRHVVYPPEKDRLAVLDEDPAGISVVIIGQDPYISPRQAHGYCFSVPDGTPPPPSLVNIYKEIEAEGYEPCNRSNGNLLPWVRQGVFLLNTHLTVREGVVGSHREYGWERFTDLIMTEVQAIKSGAPLVFMLWGNDAKRKRNLIFRSATTLVIETSHPSPLGAYKGFMGSGCFRACNDFLVRNNANPMDWTIR